MAYVDEDLPRLKDLVDKLKVLEPASVSQEIVWQQLRVAVHLSDLLVKASSQGSEHAKLVGHGLKNQLFARFELGILRQLRIGIK